MNHIEQLAGQVVRPSPRAHDIANLLIPALLRTPVLHRLLSRELMLITFTGRKSGRSFTTPVTFMPVDCGVAFFSNQRWWTNLRGGAPVMLRLSGRDVAGYAEPVEDRATVAREARAYLERRGIRNAGKIGLELSASREPNDIELEKAVRNHVVVYVTLDRA